MNRYHSDMNSLLARERYERRLRDAEVERLAHIARGSAPRRRLPRVTIGLPLRPRQRVHQPRFNAYRET